jgi:hypothetical protein
VNTQNVLKKLFELRAVLERISETDPGVFETIANDIDEALRLADSCIAELASEGAAPRDADESGQ